MTRALPEPVGTFVAAAAVSPLHARLWLAEAGLYELLRSYLFLDDAELGGVEERLGRP